MRTIKFRGKVDDENEWVYGYLVLISNGDEHLSIYQPEPHDKSVNCGCGIFSVHKESIGQFTGLYDIDNKEIYEGDILRDIFGTTTKIVYFNEEKAAYCVREKFNDSYYDELLCELCEYEWKVIGNVFDMPDWEKV